MEELTRSERFLGHTPVLTQYTHSDAYKIQMCTNIHIVYACVFTCACASAGIAGCTFALSRLALHTSYVFIVSFIFSTFKFPPCPLVSDTSLPAIVFKKVVIYINPLKYAVECIITLPNLRPQLDD